MTTATLTPRLLGAVRGIDRVVLASLVLLAGLAATVPQQAAASAVFAVESILGIFPYMALAVLMAAWARASGADEQIARAFAAHETMAILGASLIGALAPFCGIGVVPLVAAALIAGVPLSAVMAFWIASPLMNPAIYLLSASEFGTTFATARLVSSVGLGLIAGYATHWLMSLGMFADGLKPELRTRTNACGIRAAHVAAPIAWRFWGDPARRAAFAKETRKTGLLLLKWMTLAFLLESLLVAYVPNDLIHSWVGGDTWWAIPVSVAVGTPAYLNGYAAIPTVARLVEMGMSPGAALAFLTAGAVTCIPAMAGVIALVRAPLFAWYMILGVGGALLSGYAYQILIG